MSKTRDLQPDEAAYVDSAVVESADGRIPWSRFETLVEAKVAQAAPELAREAEDQRRVHAFLLMVTGAADDTDLADLLPGVTVFVHTYAGPDREGVMRVEGHGPVTEEWVRQLLGPHARFTIQPVLDLAGQAPVDAYEIPDRHRRAVHLMTPADTFPFASSTSRSMQVDHTRTDDVSTSPGQDAWAMAGPATLPRPLRLARPVRRRWAPRSRARVPRLASTTCKARHRATSAERPGAG